MFFYIKKKKKLFNESTFSNSTAIESENIKKSSVSKNKEIFINAHFDRLYSKKGL